MNEIEIKKLIANEIFAGKNLSDIQKILVENHIELTFFELKNLMAEIEDLRWKEEEKKTEILPKSETRIPIKKVEDESDFLSSRCQVIIEEIIKPNCVMNGKTIFPSGLKATWWIDNLGRPGLDVENGVEPSKEDLVAFQHELQLAVKNQGF